MLEHLKTELAKIDEPDFKFKKLRELMQIEILSMLYKFAA